MDTDKTSDVGEDRMRVVSYRHIRGHVYEVVTESRKYGRVSQRVLVLPGSAIQGESDDR